MQPGVIVADASVIAETGELFLMAGYDHIAAAQTQRKHLETRPSGEVNEHRNHQPVQERA
jgi:hypothetical protein